MFNLGVNSAKLQAGMTVASINSSDVSQKIKDKQIELFTKYNVNQNDTIDEEEFATYKKDEKTHFWKKVAISAVALGTACVAGYLAYKGFKSTKSVQVLPTAVKNSTETLGETVQASAKIFNPDNFMNKIITTKIPGQKVLITSDLENNSEYIIATFFNNGVPSSPTKLPMKKLSYFISNLV